MATNTNDIKSWQRKKEEARVVNNQNLIIL